MQQIIIPLLEIDNLTAPKESLSKVLWESWREEFLLGALKSSHYIILFIPEPKEMKRVVCKMEITMDRRVVYVTDVAT